MNWIELSICFALFSKNQSEHFVRRYIGGIMIENLLGIDSDFIIIGMLAVLIIFLILIIVIMTRLGKL